MVPNIRTVQCVVTQICSSRKKLTNWNLKQTCSEFVIKALVVPSARQCTQSAGKNQDLLEHISVQGYKIKSKTSCSRKNNFNLKYPTLC